MNVFISWAKEPSKAVAEALRDWLPDILQSVKPFVSTADIDAGSRWSVAISNALASSKIGIVCVTANNQHDPWLTFEAGAIAKTLENTFVCPFLIGMTPPELSAGPLTQFQAKTATKEGAWDLVTMINNALPPDETLATERLRRLFDRSWADFENRLAALPPAPRAIEPKTHEMLVEIVGAVRSITRHLTADRIDSDFGASQYAPPDPTVAKLLKYGDAAVDDEEWVLAEKLYRNALRLCSQVEEADRIRRKLRHLEFAKLATPHSEPGTAVENEK